MADIETERALWERPDLRAGDLSDDQIAFLSTCMEENLEHARHVENERLTFNSIFMALVAGVLAFVYSIDTDYRIFAISVILLLIVVGFIAMQLTKRWDNTFDRHIHFAKGCCRLLHEHMFPPLEGFEGTLDENEKIEGLEEMSAYCFRPMNPIPDRKINHIRTRKLFSAFYWLIEAVLLISLVYFIVETFL